jgi:hypothetical protein
MNRFRRRRLRTRIAWLALLGLLWTQVALAGHGLCAPDAFIAEAVPATAATPHGCHDAPAADPVPSVDTVVCKAHCAQGDQNTESARETVFAVLPTPRWVLPAAIGLAGPERSGPLRQPRGPRRRPTAHPATLLLI